MHGTSMGPQNKIILLITIGILCMNMTLVLGLAAVSGLTGSAIAMHVAMIACL